MTADIYFPEAVGVQGNEKIMFCTAVTSETGPSVTTDIGGATSVEGTEALYGTAFSAPVNVNTGNAPRRVGTREQLPREGNAQRQSIPLAYVTDPAKPDTDNANKLKALLVPDTIIYAIVRRGVPKETPFAESDPVRVYKCRAGYQHEPQPSGDDEFAEYQIMQNLVPIAEPVDAVLVA